MRTRHDLRNDNNHREERCFSDLRSVSVGQLLFYRAENHELQLVTTRHSLFQAGEETTGFGPWSFIMFSRVRDDC